MEYDYTKVEPSCPNISCNKKENDCCGLSKVFIAAVLGDDSSKSNVRPCNGAYHNKIVEYEANGAVYIYGSDGIYTNIKEGKK